MEILILLAILVCPIVMGTMMLLMMRGMRGSGRAGEVREASVEQRQPGATDATS